MHLLAYQRAWLLDRSRLRVWLASRRVGKTSVCALEESMRAAGIDGLVEGAVTYDPKRGVNQYIVSASEPQSIAHLDECARHLEALSTIVGVQLTASVNKTRIEMRNGRELVALAANARTIRGSGGDLTLEEIGAMAAGLEILRAGKPIADPSLGAPGGHRVRAIGTPLGDDTTANLMAALWLGDLGKAWSKHRTDIHDAIADGFPGDATALAEEMGGEASDGWREEYLVELLGASTRYFSEALLNASTYHGAPPEHAVPSDAGLDVGRKKDLSACARLVEADGVLYALPVDTIRNATFGEQKRWLVPLVGAALLHVDATGIGLPAVDQFSRRDEDGPALRCNPRVFTNALKSEMFGKARLLMERGLLKIPASDLDARRSLLKIKREITAANNVTLTATREGGEHGDLATAIVLAAHGATEGCWWGSRSAATDPLAGLPRRWDQRQVIPGGASRALDSFLGSSRGFLRGNRY